MNDKSDECDKRDGRIECVETNAIECSVES